MVNAGGDLEQLLLLTINDINDVPNAPRATLLASKVPDDNTPVPPGNPPARDAPGARRDRAGFGTNEETDGASDPIAKGSVLGRDLLEAAKDGYVYRTRGAGQVTLLKRQKDLFLRIRPAFIHSPEMEEVSRIFHLTPGLSKYRIKSELSEETDSRLPSPMGDDTIYLNLRSVLQIMTFLSKGVCVPEEHLVSGMAPVTPGPDGRPFDWTQVTAGHFIVHAQKHRPRAAEAAVPYRGYWFYIARDDVNSRAVLAILEILFALQESDVRSVGPLLTLPVGG